MESPKGKERARVFGDISPRKKRKVADLQVADIQWLIRAGSRAGIIKIAFTVLGMQATVLYRVKTKVYSTYLPRLTLGGMYCTSY